MYFDGIDTMEELKRAYRKLVMQWHPDVRGGDTAKMAAINSEYDSAFNRMKSRAAHSDVYASDQTEETPDEFRAVIYALLHIDGIEVELCGKWVWVTGDTYAVRDSLKAAGMRWSAKKRAWYWHSPKDVRKRHKRSYSMEQIRDTYGSKRFARSAGAIVVA